jgi:hypothetical protein
MSQVAKRTSTNAQMRTSTNAQMRTSKNAQRIKCVKSTIQQYRQQHNLRAIVGFVLQRHYFPYVCKWPSLNVSPVSRCYLQLHTWHQELEFLCGSMYPNWVLKQKKHPMCIHRYMCRYRWILSLSQQTLEVRIHQVFLRWTEETYICTYVTH